VTDFVSDWPNRNGEMAASIRSFDWSATPLGPLAAWPANLRTMVDLALDNPVATILLWGPDLIQLYNDPWRILMGDKHPAALGQTTHASFPELVETVTPLYRRLHRGEAVTLHDTLLPIRRRGALEEAWWDIHCLPVRGEGGTVDGIFGTVNETTGGITARRGLAEAIAALRESEERFRGLVEGFGQFSWEASADGVIEVDSPGWRAFTGQSLANWLGYGWAEAIHPDDRAGTEQTWREVIATGSSVDYEYRLWHAPSASWRWSNVRAVPITNPDGSIRKWSGMNIDVTDRHKLLSRQEVLVNELQHRARNLLGVVASIADSTVRQGGSVEAFEQRLQALSRAQDLLSQAGSDKVEVGALVRAELAAHAESGSRRARVSGPEVHLTARQVQNFALALHELATNAVKYGALRNGAGELLVTWEVVLDKRQRRRLALCWVESGVAVEPDKVTRRGYGTELIQEALTYALEAKVDYELGKDGVRCRIEMPVS
jgi:PAS domain S-box-containing protein